MDVCLLHQRQRYNQPSPIAKMKALKNDTEIAGMKRAHVRYLFVSVVHGYMLGAVCSICGFCELVLNNVTILYLHIKVFANRRRFLRSSGV